eukprot:1344234-Amorphochlora_amoeboformis.AAC.1
MGRPTRLMRPLSCSTTFSVPLVLSLGRARREWYGCVDGYAVNARDELVRIRRQRHGCVMFGIDALVV